MAKIIDGLPRMICPSCKCTFEYDANDVQAGVEQCWGGILKGWVAKGYRFVKCPGCARKIRL